MPSKAATAGKKPVVICLGDSHTNGFLGASWLKILQFQHPGLHFVNAGIDGQPSDRILRRLRPLLQRYPNPLAVLLMPGSNDNIAMNSTELQLYYNIRFLAKNASFASFEAHTREMLTTLQQESPTSKVILITLPPSTEHPQHGGNVRLFKFTSIAQQLGRSFPEARVIDFHSTCVDYLRKHSSAWKQAAAAAGGAGGAEGGAAEPKGRMFRFSVLGCGLLMAVSVMQHYVLGQSWDAIGKARGLRLLVDQVHLNDTAAKLLAEQLEPVMQQLEQQVQSQQQQQQQ